MNRHRCFRSGVTAVIQDMSGDASHVEIDQEVKKMELGRLNAFMTKGTLGCDAVLTLWLSSSPSPPLASSRRARSGRKNQPGGVAEKAGHGLSLAFTRRSKRVR